MSRTIHEERLLMLLKSEFSRQPLTSAEQEKYRNMTPEDWNGLMEVAQSNRMFPLLMNALVNNPAVPIPMHIGRFLQHQTLAHSMVLYQKVFLISSLLELMQQENVHGYVIKGITISALYPNAETRSFSDIDLYIPEQTEFRRFCDKLKAMGCPPVEDDMTDYHESYVYSLNGVSSDVEVHYRLSTSWNNGDFDARLSDAYAEGIRLPAAPNVEIMDLSIPVLPATLDALYLLMHLFQHFMNRGFGLKLFADWVAFWNGKGTQVDVDLFRHWIRRLHLETFLDAVTTVCSTYLGHNPEHYGWMLGGPLPELAEELLQDVFDGGEYGHKDENRMVVTTRKAGIKSYALELHRQMKKRYPKACRYRVLWPFLWVGALVMFEYNNIFHRQISFNAVLHTSTKRNELAQKMDIFEER